jgi:sarcosine oxidase subunit beta
MSGEARRLGGSVARVGLDFAASSPQPVSADDSLRLSSTPSEIGGANNLRTAGGFHPVFVEATVSHPDIVIVGGGIIGSSIAYHLALRKVPVVVVDVAEPVSSPSASWASAGGVRHQGRDRREWPLTREASRRWPALEEELGAPFEFRRGGHLHVVERDEDVRALKERVAREREGGLDVRIVNPDELRGIAPGITSEARLGAYSPNDGQANPRKATRAFACAAAARGARYRTDCRTIRLERAGDDIQGIVVDGERIVGGWVVLAAGAWSPRLAGEVGIALAIAPRALQMVLTDLAPPALTPTVTAMNRRLSLKQLPSGEFLIGGGWPSAIDAPGTPEMSCHLLPENVDGSWQVASSVFPPLRARRIVQSWCGLEGEAIDGVPLIGSVPGVRRLYVAAGFSGHGFQLSPAVGRSVADALLGSEDGALAQLAPSRLAHLDPDEVRAFTAGSTGRPWGTLG